MSDKLALVRLFNTKAEEFCKDLILTFPEVKEFKQLKSALMLLSNLDEKKPRELFNRFLTSEIKNRLVAKDETFFMDEIYQHINIPDIIESVSLGGASNAASQWEGIVELLRSLWKELNNDNKEVIWKYFHVLVAVNDKCNN